MENEKKKKIKKVLLNIKFYEYFLPFIHFLASCIYERELFIFDNNWDFVNEIARNDYVSNQTELVIVYIMSKICGGIVIFLFWKFVFAVIKGTINKKVAFLFGAIFVIGTLVGLFLYPYTISVSIDNCLNYAMAIRFLPTYWQSVYTGVVYAGSMMFFPHPFGIYLVQWMAMVAVILYLYIGLEKVFKGRNWKYASLLFFLLPETFYVVLDAYRNNYYTILCLFYFAYLIFSLRDKEKKILFFEMIIMSMISAFIMVWRSEGVLIGIGGMFVLMIAYHVKWKQTIVLLGVFLCTFLIANSIQDIGAKKYYGQDYMIVNTAEVLHGIFNNPNANFYYEGAKDDLMAIERVVPVQVLKEGGLTGFRNYNWTMGRANFNQTLADDETAAEYMAAYYRIILHNEIEYLNVQTNSLFESLQIDSSQITYSYTDKPMIQLEEFDYYRWKQGYEEYRQTFLTQEWDSSAVRRFGYAIISWFVTFWRSLWIDTALNSLLHAMAIIGNIALACMQLIKYVLYKEKKSLEYLVYFVILVGQMFAVLLFMPVAKEAYLYPILYVSYFVIGFYSAEYFWKHNKMTVLEEK